MTTTTTAAPIYENKIECSPTKSGSGGFKASSLFCHQQSLTSSPAVKKRNKLAYSYSSVGTWDAARRSKKNRRHYHSMNETIEVLADPVVEDDIFVSTLCTYNFLLLFIVQYIIH